MMGKSHLLGCLFDDGQGDGNNSAFIVVVIIVVVVVIIDIVTVRGANYEAPSTSSW